MAGPGRGRHSALHGPVPGEQPEGRRPGAQLALLLHRVGIGVELRVRARGRLPAGPRGAPLGKRARQARVRRGRIPVRRPLPVAHQDAVRAPQRLHGREAPPADGQEGRCEGRDLQARLEVRAGHRPGQAAQERHDRRPVPREQDHVQVRPPEQPLPALRHGREEAGGRGLEEPRGAQERDRHGRPDSAASTTGRTRTGSRRSSRARDGHGSRPTGRPSRGPGRRAR